MRPSKDDTFMEMAVTLSKRSTCLRREVGCVLVNKRNHVIATGYNGGASGLKHCNYISDIAKVSMAIEHTHPYACDGAFSESGTDLDKCNAIHAEQNALLQCKDVWNIDTVYVTTSPCTTCTKLLMNTGARRIVFKEAYAHDTPSKELWLSNPVHLTLYDRKPNREWVKYQPRTSSEPV